MRGLFVSCETCEEAPGGLFAMSARYLRDSANPLAERSFARASTEQKSPGKPRSLTSAFVALRASLLNVIGKARSQTEEDAERHEGGHRSVSKRHVRMPDEAENRPLATLVPQGVVVDEKRNAGFRLYEVMMEVPLFGASFSRRSPVTAFGSFSESKAPASFDARAATVTTDDCLGSAEIASVPKR